MADRSGINTPFDKAWPTPDTGGTGANGIGGGMEQGNHGNGIVNSPWTATFVPTPSGEGTPAADIPTPPDTCTIDGGSPSGSQAPWDSTRPQSYVDRS